MYIRMKRAVLENRSPCPHQPAESPSPSRPAIRWSISTPARRRSFPKALPADVFVPGYGRSEGHGVSEIELRKRFHWWVRYTWAVTAILGPPVLIVPRRAAYDNA